MRSVALKGLLGRKTRAVLTSMAIVLGVAMISGTFVLTDTIQKAFNGIFTSSYQHTDVIVSGKEIVKNSRNRPTVPESLLAKVRALPDVAAAAGEVSDSVELIDRDGKKIGGQQGTPTFGFGVDPKQPRFNPAKLSSGSWASGPHEVVIDPGTASKHHYRIGDSIGAKGNGPIGRYTITGFAKLGGASIGGATFAAFDVPTAQAILGKSGRFDQISAAARHGVSQAKLAAEVRPLLPATAEVKTAGDQARKASKEITSGINAIRIFLLAFAAIALFVGAFVIFNTISITVAQRAREFATLRTLGASRRQVLRSVLLESLLIGLLASAIGLALGLGLAKGLNAVFVALGVSLPQAGTVFATRTAIVSLLGGTIVTLAAGLFPAIRATRVPPISAVREGAVLPASRLARFRPVIAGALIVLGIAAIADGLFGGGAIKTVLVTLGAGTLLLFLGIAMISSNLVRPLAALVGFPARRLGGTAGRLAAENAVRNTSRTATTAAALMIGLALVTFVATLGAGVRSSERDALDKQIRADYVVSPSGGSDSGLFPAAAGDALVSVPGVTVASSVRNDRARILGESVDVVGVDSSTIGSVYHFDWKQGSDDVLPLLGGVGAVVKEDYAKKHHLALGSGLSLETPEGVKARFVVKGIYSPPKVDSIFSGVIVSQLAFDSVFPRPSDLYTFVAVPGGATDAATAGLKHALAGFPDATVQTKSVWVTKRANDINKTLALFYVLLALSVIVSLFGMINTMILSVFERTRELGMLRAIGMTRMQVRRMIRQESVITALIGAALGLPLGLFLAGLVTRGLSSEGIGFHLPVLSLLIFAAVAVLAGTLAAVAPARRASRLDVLQALQYE